MTEEEQDILSIERALGALRAPHTRTPMLDRPEILMVALCSILSRADSWLGIQYRGEAKLESLRRYLPLANGTSSHDTFPATVRNLLYPWDSCLCPALAAHVVAIDGKTVRRSNCDGKRAIHQVPAYAT